MAAEDEIATVLTSGSLAGGTTGWTIRLLRMDPDERGRMVLITPTGGPEADKASDREWQRPTYQILVRGNPSDHEATLAKARAIHAALDGATITGFLDFFATQSDPFSLGQNEQLQPQYTVNFRGFAS